MTRREKIEKLWRASSEIDEAVYSLERAGMRRIARNLRREREDIIDEIDQLESEE